jgi:NAD(P)H-hydrate epimerase
VTIATPGCCVPIVASLAAEYMTEPLTDTAAGEVAESAVDTVLALRQDVIACGPGLGRSEGASAFVRALVERSPVPLVLDADAVLAFADEPGLLMGRDERHIVITPHPGEMARLVGKTIEDVQADRIGIASEFAATHQVYVVLKGHRTVIATPSGAVAVNPTGNPGMATGGTGDVLTGMIAAWLAQLLDADAACRLAVFLHGAAGDLAAGHEGRVSMIAGDLINHLGAALEQLTTPPAAEGRDG